jgi:hypothetical protein
MAYNWHQNDPFSMHPIEGHPCCPNFLAQPIRREGKFGPTSKLAIYKQKCKLSKRTDRKISLALYHYTCRQPLNVDAIVHLTNSPLPFWFLPLIFAVGAVGRGANAQGNARASAFLSLSLTLSLSQSLYLSLPIARLEQFPSSYDDDDGSSWPAQNQGATPLKIVAANCFMISLLFQECSCLTIVAFR